jgi:KipI family sensor histidine kinase inhibitor
VGADTRIVAASDQAFLVRLGDDISESTHARVVAALAALDHTHPPWLADLVPAYASVLVVFDPAAVSPDEVAAWIAARLAEAIEIRPEPRAMTVPVLYDPAVGLDLLDLSRELGLAVEELVALHCGRDYLVYMLGFKPGFPYLGTLDDRLVVPRLATPRTAVPAGSVAIAGRQTGIYPVQSPGGWHVIGRTPLAIFAPTRSQPFLLRSGDRVRFEPIDKARFDALAANPDKEGTGHDAAG